MPVYTPARSSTVKLTAAIHVYLDLHPAEFVNGGTYREAPEAWLIAWLGIHGDEGTPGMEHP